MIQSPKLELDFVMGLSTAQTSRKTAFFLKDNNILAPAGRQLFLFRSGIFEQHGLGKEIKREDQHLIKMTSDCHFWLKRFPRAILEEGHSNKTKTFFVFNLKEPGPLDEDPEEGTRSPLEQLTEEPSFQHPVIFFLDCLKGEVEIPKEESDPETFAVQDPKKWKHKNKTATFDPELLKLNMWEFREFKNCKFESVSLFSQDDEHHLIALTSERPQSLVSFNFSKMRTTGVNTLIKKHIYDRVAVNPEDKYLVIATGETHKTIKLHRINDKMKGDSFSVKSSIKHEGLAHPQWLNANCFLVVANEGFGIFLFCLNKKLKIELVQRIEHFDGMYQNDLYRISFVQKFSQGFICGLNDGSVLLFLDDKKGLIRYKMKRGDESKKRFLPVSRVQLASKAKPIALDFIQGEDKFLQISDDNSLCIVPSCSLIGKDNFNLNLISDFSLSPKQVMHKGHALTRKQGRIDRVDIAKFKPLILLISKSSNSVSIVDFERRVLIQNKTFPKEGTRARTLTSGAIHPSGLFCLLGFEEKLELCSIAYSQIM